MNKILSCLFILLFAVLGVYQAQTLPVATVVLKEQYRRLQLIGAVDSTLSLDRGC